MIDLPYLAALAMPGGALQFSLMDASVGPFSITPSVWR